VVRFWFPIHPRTLFEPISPKNLRSVVLLARLAGWHLLVQKVSLSVITRRSLRHFPGFCSSCFWENCGVRCCLRYLRLSFFKFLDIHMADTSNFLANGRWLTPTRFSVIFFSFANCFVPSSPGDSPRASPEQADHFCTDQ